MSAIAPARPKTIVPDSPHREAMADFVHWATAQLQAIDREASLDLNVAGELHVAELMERLRAAGPAVHARPSGQPAAVADVAARLFAAYRITGGQIQLTGCQLTDVPFVRLSLAADDIVRHVFVSQAGETVPAELVEQLGLLDIEPTQINPARIDGEALEELIARGRRSLASSAEPLVVAVVWAKHATGKLQFTIGDSATELPFTGWASLLAAPPFVSEYSGASGYHLAATDDGRIDLAAEIVACAESGRRVLARELVTCCVTGKRVLPEFTDTCPVAGKPALVDQYATCEVCRQRVSKTVLDNQTCAACREMSKVSKDDPRLVCIVSAHPGLQGWSRWKLAETEQAYIARADGFLKRLLAVVDKRSLAVRHLAVARCFSREWQAVSTAEKQKLLT